MSTPSMQVGPPSPVPYLPAVLVKPETVQGVKTYKVNLVLDIVFGAFALTIGLVAILANPSNLATAVLFGAVLGAASCGLVIVFVINFIVSLMSVFKMHHGREEYGSEHSRYALYGVVFKWTGTALSTAAAVLVAYLVIAGSTAFFRTGDVPPTVFVPLLITAFWTAGVTCKGQMYRFFVRALQPPETRRQADIASLLIPALGIVGIGIVAWLTIRVLDIFADPFAVDPAEATRLFQMMIGAVFIPPGFALVGYIILLTVYGKTSDRLMEGLSRLHAAMAPPPGWPGYAPPPWAARPPPPAVPPASAAPGSPPDSSPPHAAATPVAPASASPPKFCPQCGRPTSAGAAFCMHCGTRLSATA